MGEKTSRFSNVVLNDFIAKIFSSSGSGKDNVLHYFLAKTSSGENVEWIEIRKVGAITFGDISLNESFNYFFSVIRQNSVDIITVSEKYNKPNKARKYEHIKNR